MSRCIACNQLFKDGELARIHQEEVAYYKGETEHPPSELCTRCSVLGERSESDDVVGEVTGTGALRGDEW